MSIERMRIFRRLKNLESKVLKQDLEISHLKRELKWKTTFKRSSVEFVDPEERVELIDVVRELMKLLEVQATISPASPPKVELTYKEPLGRFIVTKKD